MAVCRTGLLPAPVRRQADLPRRLLFPPVVESGARLFSKFIADGIRGNPQALDNFIENIKRGTPLHEFAKKAELRAGKK